MNVTFAVTITGPETKGMLKKLAEITHSHSARWLHSRTIHLAGRVACLLEVIVPEEQHQSLENEFTGLEGFHVECHSLDNRESVEEKPLNISFDANDRPGLVSAIAHTLENLGIRIDHIDSHRMSVTGLGTNVFTAQIKAYYPEQSDLELMTSELEKLSDNALVEIKS